MKKKKRKIKKEHDVVFLRSVSLLKDVKELL
jgi:hypothetical protein